MPTITLDDVCFSYTSQPLLENITMHIANNERACLVGPNGSGKTTLLKIITGELAADSGSTRIDGTSSNVRSQLSTLSAYACNGGTVGAYLDRALTQMTAADLWSLDARINETLVKLDLVQLQGTGRTQSVACLSPGERRRLVIAATLIVRPPILVLDEPTNHMDAAAVQFLARTITAWDGPVIMASHDRDFIDQTATAVYDLDISAWQQLATAEGRPAVQGIYRCAGTYHDYVEAKAAARRTYAQLYTRQRTEKRDVNRHRESSKKIARGGVRLATSQGIAKKFFADRAAATSVRRTRNDDRRLERLADREVRKPRSYDLHFPLQQVSARSGLAVSARSAAVEGRLAPTTFDLSYGEHLLITGANGAGKSTLLRWIAEDKPPAGVLSSGNVSRDKAIAAVLQRLPRLGDPGFDEKVWHAGIGDLGRGVIHPAMWATPIADLSAGNQRRAQIAVAIAQQPEILLIDEPTNYLDLDAADLLEESLNSWPGTLVITSHDRWLIRHWKGRRLEL